MDQIAFMFLPALASVQLVVELATKKRNNLKEGQA